MRVRYQRLLSGVTFVDVAWVLLLSLPFAVFFTYVYRYAINIPTLDDYPGVLGFLNSFLTADTLRAKAGWFWLQHNENRILLLKAQVLLQYALLGHVDFRGLLVIGNLAYALVAVLFVRAGIQMGIDRFRLLFVPYLLLAPASSENITFVAGQVYIWAVLFTLLFFIALIQDRPWVAYVLYCMEIFTFAGGLLLYPIGLAFLMMKARWKQSIAYFVASTLVTLLYFYHHYGSSNLDKAGFLDIDKATNAFFAFFGTAFFSYDIALILGVALALLLGIIVLIEYGRNDFMLLTAAWLLLNGGAVALARNGVDLGVGTLPPRYDIYSQLALALVLLWMISRTSTISAVRGRGAVAAFLVALAFFSTVLLVDRARQWFDHERDYKIHGLSSLSESNIARFLAYPDSRYAKQTLLESQRLGVYDYQAAALGLRRPVHWLNGLPPPNASLRYVIEQNAGNEISGWALMPYYQSNASTVHVLLGDPDQFVSLASYRTKRPEVSRDMGVTGTYDDSGFDVFLSAYALPPGTYRIGVMVQNGIARAIEWSQESVAIPETQLP